MTRRPRAAALRWTWAVFIVVVPVVLIGALVRWVLG